jgi:hypothetical protein
MAGWCATRDNSSGQHDQACAAGSTLQCSPFKSMQAQQQKLQLVLQLHKKPVNELSVVLTARWLSCLLYIWHSSQL